jgi:biopolymer transport protein ExbB
MEGMSWTEMMRLSVAMPILLVLSVLMMAQALERLYVYWFSQRLPTRLWDRVRQRLQAGDILGAAGICRLGNGTMEQGLERLLSLPDPTTERLIEAFQYYRQRLSLDLSRRVGFFGTCSFVSPLIGLMGTVLGIMRAFHDLAKAGAGGPAVVAAGISEALVATAAGIGLAVVSALFYNYFTLTARQRLTTADLWVFEIASVLAQRQEAQASGRVPGPRL